MRPALRQLAPATVTQRGVRSMDVFPSDGDRQEYLRLLAEQGEDPLVVDGSWRGDRRAWREY